MDLQALRREYTYAGLDRADLHDDPVVQFERWMQNADDAGLQQPNAMYLATADAQGFPSLRTVLLKQFDEKGFVFFTNYGSRKARQIAENDRVAALFTWLEFDRQVKIQGRAEKISTAQSLAYFMTRPRGSQIGAWCSPQSEIISDRDFLESRIDAMKQKFLNKEIPLPDFWGGYRIVPDLIEFWQGRENRVHDRFQYRPEGDRWVIDRLAP